MSTSGSQGESYKSPDCEQGDASGGNPGPIPRDVDTEEGGVIEATVVVMRALNAAREYMIDILRNVDIHINMWKDINWEEDLHDTEPITRQEVTERASRYCLNVVIRTPGFEETSNYRIKPARVEASFTTCDVD